MSAHGLVTVPVQRAADVLPTDADLPGRGWLAIDEGFEDAAGRAGIAETRDCVGPDFPSGADVLDTAGSPHYLHPPGRLVHGFALLAASDDAATRAEQVLTGRAFAECLGRSVAADLTASDTDAELLGVDVESTERGQRVRFTGGTEAGVRPVQLDVVCLRLGRAVGLLWFADTPGPFDPGDADEVLARIRSRAA